MATYQINLEIPLNTSEVKERLVLLESNISFFDDILDLLKKSRTAELGKDDIAKISHLKKKPEYLFTDIDKGLLFSTAFLLQVDSFGDDLINNLDITPKLSKVLTSKSGLSFKEVLKQEGESLRDTVLGYIRSKLALREILYVITKDRKFLLELISITPQYLKCNFINQEIERAQYESIYSDDAQKRRQQRKFISDLKQVMAGNTKAKKKIREYWRLHYYFSEVSACIETYYEIVDDKEAKGYLKDISFAWDIPKIHQDLIEGKADSVTNIVLSILEDRKAIKSGELFLKGYYEHVKELKDTHVSLGLLHEVIYSLFDLLNMEPIFFVKVNSFKLFNKS